MNAKKKFKIPDRKFPRILLGWAFVIGGILGFLPVVGFWMLPIGVIILSVDSHFFRKMRRKFEIWWGRNKPSFLKTKD